MKDVIGGMARPVDFGKIKVHTRSGRIGRVVGEINSPRIMLKLRFSSGVEEAFSWGALHPATREQALKFERSEANPILRRAGPGTRCRVFALAEG